MKIKDVLPVLTNGIKYFWQGGKLNTITAVTATAAAYEFSPELVSFLGAILSPEVAMQGATGGAGVVVAGLLAGIRLIAGWFENRK